MVMVRGQRRIAFLLSLTAVLMLAGCSGVDIEPTSNPERIGLNAEDVYKILSAIGFEDDEVIDRGREFRNQLARHGAVTIRDGDTVVAMVAVRGSMVHVTSLGLGSFVYDPSTRSIR
jgi:hypothetical protein